ncbi:hypothetical protein NHX12_024251 [Muraenolepis orangiensis]|uniref:Uncharacterized protein n=1 Tax=Muraenolepis orangiensis TaxID=630683 RepID=A0A9Q0EQE5_9TELE|nr:hypothetical protein NHX12_024251 [Muraenolepis orangiensis]
MKKHFWENVVEKSQVPAEGKEGGGRDGAVGVHDRLSAAHNSHEEEEAQEKQEEEGKPQVHVHFQRGRWRAVQSLLHGGGGGVK